MKPIPEDPESERYLLATLCAPGNETALQVHIPGMSEKDFVVPAHQRLFKAIQHLVNSHQEVNALTIMDAPGLKEHISQTEVFDILGAMEVGRPETLIAILKRKRLQRDLIALGGRLYREAGDTFDPAELMATIAGELSSLAQSTDKGNAEAVNRFSDEALALVADRIQGKSTFGTKFQGWPRLNGLTHGFQPGQLIVLAARPGIGKTALALNWVLRAAQNRKPSAVFSLEMGKEELWNRLVADKSGVNYREMIEKCDHEAFALFAQGKAEVDALPIHVSDRGKITVTEIAAQVDRIIARHGALGLVVVDYLQLITSPSGNKSQTETTRIGEITRSLKLLAKDRHVPILLLSQLNRESDKRSGGKPQLTDLRDSGCIEQDADVVMFIHRDMRATSTDLIIAKHRNGPVMDLPLVFKPELTRYIEIERETDHNIHEYQDIREDYE
ncbi:replicative DNA helicase [Mesoterricola silvestris]|uniref:DNA 5'-3' helicase n=1 Tax=Mesoterricola silvestris TaxID=2927979 RepID=A0AA48H5R8_9BACT|nr:DnaB-like helicase C-terminal domain-containing protein [Mesoterricola silvestris]BDU72363.1 replicative DNA helicase [Mesoterricola silvestris]